MGGDFEKGVGMGCEFELGRQLAGLLFLIFILLVIAHSCGGTGFRSAGERIT